ncbi:MAG TPA: serine/threonine-protein kinase, partial [Gemmatimonadales bacterium]|nr:serine/threonine-protein kinase [Gemmatimonadales bacterium]
IGWALAAAHGAGVLHRDITLSNIMIDRMTGRAMLVDFGLALEFDAGEDTPLVGTAEYLAPELLHGAAPTPGSDLYSLGIVGWALCAGRLPITADTPSEVLLRRLQEAPAALDQVAPGTPRFLRLAIEAALADDPAQRPGTMEAWLATFQGSRVAHTPALPLMRWVESGTSARPFYALTFSLAGMLGVTLDAFWGLVYLPLVGRVSLALAIIIVSLGAGALVHAGMAIAAIRRAASAGYVVTDLRGALADAMRQRVARGTVAATLMGRVVNDLAWIAGGTALIVVLIASSGGAREWIGASIGLSSFLWVILDSLQWLCMAWFVGIGFGFVLPARAEQPRNLRWRWREAFWNSPLGSIAFRLASLGIGRRREAPNTLHRPTEVMLQVGISELHAALPAPQRESLGELPAVAERLQRRVGKVRERIALLEGPAGKRSAEAAALRDRLVTLRDEAITALERLRRDLLRLGSEVATSGPLTEQLRLLRDADQQLVRALHSIP